MVALCVDHHWSNCARYLDGDGLMSRVAVRDNNWMRDIELANEGQEINKPQKVKQSSRSIVDCSYCGSPTYRASNCKNCGAPN